MKLASLGKNQTVIVMDNSDEYFFSYSTCVAGFTNGEGYWRVDNSPSRTSTKHINSYLGGAPFTTVKQSDINLSVSLLG